MEIDALPSAPIVEGTTLLDGVEQGRGTQYGTLQVPEPGMSRLELISG